MAHELGAYRPESGRRAIVIGGFGRSGTSCLLAAFVSSPSCISFGGLEAKFFCDADGLVDLYRAYVTDFAFDRAQLAVQRFVQLMEDLTTDNGVAQNSILTVLGGDGVGYRLAVSEFVKGITRGGNVRPLEEQEFARETKLLVERLMRLIRPTKSDASVFVEKTPHASLNPWIYQKAFDDVRYLWIVRDLRAVAYSLHQQEWGPRSLPECCAWVSAVFRRFLQTYNTVEHICITLEDLVRNPSPYLAALEEFTGAKITKPATFYSAEYAHRWRGKISAEEATLIQELLADDLNEYKKLIQQMNRKISFGQNRSTSSIATAVGGAA